MNAEDIVRRYIDAWNARDVDGVLDLMHPGAAYYDAFWMETCVGRDLRPYLRDSMHDDDLWYVLVGDVVTTRQSVIFRYNAHKHTAGDIGDVVFNGAEILKIHNDKILTISNMYCSPEEADLVELAEFTADRHGLTRHANEGLSALKIARTRKKLATLLDEDRIYRDPDLTPDDLAARVACTPEQLGAVLRAHYRSDYEDLINRYRIDYARQLLLGDFDNPRYIEEVATKAGFRGAREFRDRFAAAVGVTPKAYRSRHKRRALPN